MRGRRVKPVQHRIAALCAVSRPSLPMTATPGDYSTARQLITTAWNILLAIVLVVSVFGWKGGKQLVSDSYQDAKVKVAEQKEERAEKKAAKKAERDASARGRFHRGHDADADEAFSSAPREGEPDA